MARFTFSSGNLRKLLAAPLYLGGAVAATLVPRSRRLWVFGSGAGLGEGALPLYRLARQHFGGDPRAPRLLWLASTDAELDAARAAGLDAAPKQGAAGFWATLRAQVAVVTHGFGDVNRYGLRGATVVQLWHGIPLKRLHLDSPAALRVGGLPDHPIVRRIMSRALRTAGRRISVFPVASDLVAGRIATAFGIDADRILTVGDIRDDVLHEGRAAARERLEAVAGDLPCGPVLLFAPTWRDGGRDPGAPSTDEWRAIADWLDRHNGTLLVRVHPLGVDDYAAGPAASPRIRMLPSARLADVNSVLAAIDTVITDYSSIVFDYAIAVAATRDTDEASANEATADRADAGTTTEDRRRAVFIAGDLDGYRASRGLYTDYEHFAGGPPARDWAGVLDALDAPWQSGADHLTRLAAEHDDRPDGRAAERVLAELLRRTGREVPTQLAAVAAALPRIRPEIRGLELGAANGLPLLRIRIAADATLATDARLAGPRASVAAEHSPAEHTSADGTAQPAAKGTTGQAEPMLLEVPLVGERWGRAGLALPSGEYRLELGPTRSTRVTGSASLSASHELFRIEVAVRFGELRVLIQPPLADDERGPDAQRRLAEAYARQVVGVEDAVFFESFYGRSASCTPLAIDAALAAARPSTRRYWSVADRSVAVPEGAVPIVEGSRAWWRARASARLVVTNDWLRRRYVRRPTQRVLQTWHGTMLKRLALDRAGTSLRTRLAVLRESARWDVVLAQNDFAAGVFRSAYGFRGPIWIDGYPRNDVLVRRDAAELAAIRARLGLAPGARAVLYAPTWRDDRAELVDFVDLDGLAEELPDDSVLLLRGHSRTLPYGGDRARGGVGGRVLDVTSYPDASELIAVSDALVTDYSSVMFDAACVELPTVFFVPDLAHYASQLRGFYFDLVAEAPGPIVEHAAGLAPAVLVALDGAPEFRERRAEWRRRFAPHDDGLAAARVVARLEAEGLI